MRLHGLVSALAPELIMAGALCETAAISAGQACLADMCPVHGTALVATIAKRVHAA